MTEELTEKCPVHGCRLEVIEECRICHGYGQLEDNDIESPGGKCWACRGTGEDSADCHLCIEDAERSP